MRYDRTNKQTKNRLLLCIYRYDGEGPAAYFYAGSGGRPSGNGIQIANEKVRKHLQSVNLFEVKTCVL